MYNDSLLYCCTVPRSGGLNFKENVLCVFYVGSVNFGVKDVVINEP